MTRVLVVGWFSFDEVIATVGDERAAEVVSGWLTEAGVAHDVAWASYLQRGVELAAVDPPRYSHLVWVCGPVLSTELLVDLLDRFSHARRYAIGVSVLDGPAAARFDAVWARDGGAAAARPDLAIVGSQVDTGGAEIVVATVFAPVQPEYGDRGRHLQVQRTVERWISDRGLGSFDVPTDLLTPAGWPRRSTQVRAALGRADVVVSSRLHGLVLGLGRGRPVIACDPVVGGAKVSAQASALGWPVVLGALEVTPAALDVALARCVQPGGPGPSTGSVAAAVAEQRHQLMAVLV